METAEPIEELRERVSKFRQHLKGFELTEDDNIENDIAILRHAHALVEEQIRSSPGEESNAKLKHLKEKLEHRIRSLEALANESSVNTRKTVTFAAATAVAGGAALIGLGIYLAAKGRSEAYPES